MNKKEWSTGLKSFIQAQRELYPIPCRDSLTDEEESHCQIIGGEFCTWKQRHLPDIIKERIALSLMMKFDPKPIIIFTTSMPGLVAAKVIIPKPPNNLVYLHHTEYQEWEKEHSVDEFTFHIHHWSTIRKIDRKLLSKAKKAYPEVHAEEFRVHTCGVLWGEQCGVEDEHLWRWNGQEMILLEEAFSQVVF
jgi:hypothetical protein